MSGLGLNVDAVTLAERNAAIAKAQEMQQYALHLKKRLAGQIAVKNALKNALKELAPDHPMAQPAPNPVLREIDQKAMDATNWDTDV